MVSAAWVLCVVLAWVKARVGNSGTNSDQEQRVCVCVCVSLWEWDQNYSLTESHSRRQVLVRF